jgi:hypothetical protein
MAATSYNEDDVLYRYVSEFCHHLLTDVERRMDRACTKRGRVKDLRAQGNAKMAQSMAVHWGYYWDAEVEQELASGEDAFRHRTLARLLTDPAVQALINRCPRCHRIVRTPQALQCLWCHYDWHHGGKPYRPDHFNPFWRAPAVVRFAESVSRGHSGPSGHLNLTSLSVLADVVEENGCTSEEILEHLRAPLPHVRGCWVVELLLGADEEST